MERSTATAARAGAAFFPELIELVAPGAEFGAGYSITLAPAVAVVAKTAGSFLNFFG